MKYPTPRPPTAWPASDRRQPLAEHHQAQRNAAQWAQVVADARLQHVPASGRPHVDAPVARYDQAGHQKRPHRARVAEQVEEPRALHERAQHENERARPHHAPCQHLERRNRREQLPVQRHEAPQQVAPRHSRNPARSVRAAPASARPSTACTPTPAAAPAQPAATPASAPTRGTSEPKPAPAPRPHAPASAPTRDASASAPSTTCSRIRLAAPALPHPPPSLRLHGTPADAP